MIRIILALCCWLLCVTAQAGDYYHDHSVGWHWYDDPAPVAKKVIKKETVATKDPDEIGRASCRERVSSPV